MKGLEDYLFTYILVQAAGLIFLFAAYKSTRTARVLFALLFMYAAYINMNLGLTNPDVYLDYADMALPFYRSFILGPFRRYNEFIVPAIAAGQFVIGLSMLLHTWWVKWACIGAIIFLLAIAPLMVGSGFPFSLVVSLASLLILRHDKKQYIWKRPMVSAPENIA